MRWGLLACLAYACSVPPFQGRPADATAGDDSRGSAIDAASGGDPDEDSDGVADDTDNCPNLANHDQANHDSDRVGDVCDPHPGPVDTSVFYALDGNMTDVTEGNPGVFGGGALTLDAPGTATQFTWFGTTTFMSYQLVVKLVIAGPTTSTTTIEVRGEHVPNSMSVAGQGPNCQLKVISGGVQYAAINEGSIGTSPIIDNDPLAVGEEWTIMQSYEVVGATANVVCTFQNNGISRTAVTTASVPRSGGVGGVALTSAKVAVESMFTAGMQ